jgi:dTDP-4-dehydrorhamnose reductase
MYRELPHSLRVLVTGVTSIHGWPVFKALQQVLAQSNLFGIRSPKMTVPDVPNIVSACVTDRPFLQQLKERFKPTHVVHCAGVCDLDVCEERPSWASRLNTEGARGIAQIFGAECHVLYASADLVFSGINAPMSGYVETSIPDPVSVAGSTIAAAENEIRTCARWCILRLGLPIGDSVTGTKGAVDFVDYRFRRGLPVTLFHDELRSCIGCDVIGEVVAESVRTGLEGLYHCGGPVSYSLYNVGEWVLKRGGYAHHLLKGCMRAEEKNGPPRMGNVALNSARLHHVLGKAQACTGLDRDPL